MPVTPGVPGANLPPGDDALIRRIQELERAQKELLPAIMAIVGPQIATLTSQQATLTSQQATLTTAVANISTLVSQQVAGAADKATYGPAAMSTTPTAYAAVNLPVPAGYTKAWVLGFSAAFVSSGSGVSMAARIAGNDGTGVAFGSTGIGFSYGVSYNALLVTGLSGGTIAVSTVASAGSGTPVGIASTVAFALFLR